MKSGNVCIRIEAISTQRRGISRTVVVTQGESGKAGQQESRKAGKQDNGTTGQRDNEKARNARR
ncbi:hypothetical protein BCEP27_11261 [Burkholderia cepacia]